MSAGILLASCSPIYYSPNTQNTPYFTEKNQFSGTVATNQNMTEVQLATSISEKLSLQINGGYMKPKDLDNGNGGSGKFAELGLGYYKKLAGNLVFEVYGLGAFGGLENHLPSTVDSSKTTTGDISANLMRLGIQPALGYSARNFAIGLSSRFGIVNYSNIAGSLNYQGEDQVNYLKSNSSVLLAEPALTLRFGSEMLQLQAQYGLSMNMTEKDFLQNKSWLSLGISLRLQGGHK